MSNYLSIDELCSNPEIYWIDSRIQAVNANSPILLELVQHFVNYLGDGMIGKFKLFPGSILERLVKNNRLGEVNFIPSFFEQKEIQSLRQALELPEKNVQLKLSDFNTDIFMLGGQIAQILALGGPYTKMNEAKAWKLGLRLAEEEFGNRFSEVQYFSISLAEAKWFDGRGWDYCFLLIDKQKMEITFIATTGTD